jgi:D-serine deaminase-like pyridoxal phosphate-dependent protein
MQTRERKRTALPARIAEVATPAAIVDEAIARRNIERVAQEARTRGIAVRPHVKTHKSVQLAALQQALGARGITVAKIAEAEIMHAGGMADIFVCYPLVDRNRIERLGQLAHRCQVSTIVESSEQARQLGRGARSAKIELDVLIDVDTGLGRVGVPMDDALERLADHVRHERGLRLRGICTHEGFVYRIPDRKERASLVRERLSDFVCAGERVGADVISAGATPALFESMRVAGVTEVRPGNYIYNDAMQIALGAATLDDCAFTLVTTVVSVRPTERRAIIDAGSKALSADTGVHGLDLLPGYGVVVGRPDLRLTALSEEHGWLSVDPSGAGVRPGDRLRIVPNHACASAANFDLAYLCDGERVLQRLGIEARGAFE